MKKSLVALAVLAATGAYAQSSVTLYGIVEATTDIGYNRKVESTTITNGFTAAGVPAATSPSFAAPQYRNATDTAPGNILTFGTAVPSGSVVLRNEQKNNMRIQDGSSQGTGSSRVGFRGTEDLGGGLKANFLLEMGLRIDDGCTTLGGIVGPFGTAPAAAGANAVACNNGGNSEESGGSTFGRNAWGGLSGGFGEVRLGRQVLGSFGVQGNSWAAGSSNGLYDAGAGTAPAMGGVRFSNGIRYLSPDFGGFRGSLMLSAPETGGDTSTSSTTTATGGTAVVNTTSAGRRTGVDLALEYGNGPAYIGFGYNIRDTGNTASGALASTNLVNSASPGKITAYTLGGSYDLGVVKPFINYTRQNTQSNRTDSLVTGVPATSNSVATSGDATTRALSIGLRAPVGAFTVIAGYGRAITSGSASSLVTQSTGNTAYSARNEQRQTAYQLGAQYALSKRTLVEANYGQNRLENNTDLAVASPTGSGNQSVRANTRISSLNVGLKHSF